MFDKKGILIKLGSIAMSCALCWPWLMPGIGNIGSFGWIGEPELPKALQK